LFLPMSWRELGVSRWKWYYWRLLGYAEWLLQPLSAVLPRRPRLLKPPRAAVRVKEERPRSKAAKEAKGEARAGKAAVSAAAGNRGAGATGGRLGLDDLHVDLE